MKNRILKSKRIPFSSLKHVNMPAKELNEALSKLKNTLRKLCVDQTEYDMAKKVTGEINLESGEKR